MASSTRLAQEPRERGLLSTTTGLVGFFGDKVMRSAVGARLFKVHVAALLEQKDLSKPPTKATLLPGTILTLFDEELKVMVTVAAVVHVHVERTAFTKLKRVLHGHVAVTMPAESVGVLNVTTTACPLSENLLDIITGGGSTELDDSISTVEVVL